MPTRVLFAYCNFYSYQKYPYTSDNQIRSDMPESFIYRTKLNDHICLSNLVVIHVYPHFQISPNFLCYWECVLVLALTTMTVIVDGHIQLCRSIHMSSWSYESDIQDTRRPKLNCNIFCQFWKRGKFLVFMIHNTEYVCSVAYTVGGKRSTTTGIINLPQQWKQLVIYHSSGSSF